MTDSQSLKVPTFADVARAAQTIRSVVHKTPVLQSRDINQRVGAQVFFKVEAFQRTGAFKIRGAYNALANLNADQRRRGVVTYSSGNHAQAVGLASQLVGVQATVIMPEDAPPLKRMATEGYGAKIVTYKRDTEDREAIAREIAAQTGATIIPPYDHPMVMAGQGTTALEMIEKVGHLDALITPLGGGGLLSGCAIAAKTLSPDCKVYGVEPEAGNDVQQSFKAGYRIHIAPPRSIADGALTTSVGELPFAVIQSHVSDIFTVTDEQLIETMRWFAHRLKVVIEPTGALATAALLNGLVPLKPGSRVGVVVSGGNVDLTSYGPWIAQPSEGII
ncbi:threo-3-hydroxy-L-aspartate ammonia-lyase [Orrella sp. 11846]|uniref:threo-3-hydroxy-L-aspartate ammonia-lyase n=1 Tax=Orrella sp. 11846 TaxID=3409913 RepID=UPI003B59F021